MVVTERKQKMAEDSFMGLSRGMVETLEVGGGGMKGEGRMGQPEVSDVVGWITVKLEKGRTMRPNQA